MLLYYLCIILCILLIILGSVFIHITVADFNRKKDCDYIKAELKFFRSYCSKRDYEIPKEYIEGFLIEARKRVYGYENNHVSGSPAKR